MSKTLTYDGTPILNYDLEPGTYALVLVTVNGRDGWRLQEHYGRKNMSGEACGRGWLGCTNNVNEQAFGCVEVYRDSAGRRRIRVTDDDALLEEVR